MVIFHSYVTVYQEGTPWYPHHNFLKSPRISGISLRLAESTPLLSIPVLSLNALFAALDCSLRTANGKRPRHGTEGMGHGQNSWELGGICIYLYMNLYEHVPTARLKLFFFFYGYVSCADSFVDTNKCEAPSWKRHHPTLLSSIYRFSN